MKGIKKLFGIVMMIVMVTGVLTGCSSDNRSGENGKSKTLTKILEKGEITVLVTGSVPFGYKDEKTGQLAGIDGEVAAAVAKKLGIDKVKVKKVTFDSLLMELKNGNGDVTAACMYITDERKKAINFSDAYYKEGEGILYNAKQDVKSLEDLKGKKIAAQQGSAFLELAKQYKEEGKIGSLDIYDSLPDIYLAVKTGKADACIGDSAALAYNAKQDGNKTVKMLTSYKAQSSGMIGTAFAKSDDQFVEEWNQALNELKEDGTIMEILEKYGLNETYFVGVDEGKTKNS